MPIAYIAFDECQHPPFPLPRAPAGGQWMACPYEYTGMQCTLLCTSSRDPSTCTYFTVGDGSGASGGASGVLAKRDGTVCGVHYPRPLVCLQGQCQPDDQRNTTTTACDRSQACCDPFGVVRPSTFRCRLGLAADDSFRPRPRRQLRRLACRQTEYDEYCDGQSERCPVAMLPPGTPCQWAEQQGVVEVVRHGVCGDHDLRGTCVAQDNGTSTTGKSSMLQLTASPPLTLSTTTTTTTTNNHQVSLHQLAPPEPSSLENVPRDESVSPYMGQHLLLPLNTVDTLTASVAGGLLFILIIVVAVCMLRWRRRRQRLCKTGVAVVS